MQIQDLEQKSQQGGTQRVDNYHLDELKIALDPNDPRHILPPRLPPGQKVLDVGCGAGQSLIAAYPDRVSFGIDIDLDALKTAKSFSSRIALANAVAEALPFRNHQFDFVFARVALPYTRILTALKEIRRVLKPEGSVWLALHPFQVPWRHARHSNLKGKLWFAYIFLNSLAFHLFQRQFPLKGKQESFQTERGMRRALERCGFTGIRFARGKHFVVTAQVHK